MNEATQEAFSRELALLKFDVRNFREYYIHYVDSIETFNTVAESRKTLFSLLKARTLPMT